MKMGNIENKVKNSVKFERKEFNIGKINQGNDFFDQQETDESELPLSREKVFLLEQNLRILNQKLNNAQVNSGKGLNFIIELGILQQSRVCSEQLLMMGIGIKQGDL